MKGINSLIEKTPQWSAWLNLLSMSIFNVPYVDMAHRLIWPSVKEGGPPELVDYVKWLENACLALSSQDGAWDIEKALEDSNFDNLAKMDLKFYSFTKARCEKKNLKFPWELS